MVLYESYSAHRTFQKETQYGHLSFLGLNFWFINTGKIPLKEIDNNPNVILLIKEGFRPNIKEINNIELQNIVFRMWNTLPLFRPDIKEVLDTVNIMVDNIDNKNECNCTTM